MKIETRGKYPGVKIHLDPEECEILLAGNPDKIIGLNPPLTLALKMGKKISQLLKEEPGLLEKRSPEQIAAILAKESEKAALQLAALKAGKDFAKVDKQELQKALLKHAQ